MCRRQGGASRCEWHDRPADILGLDGQDREDGTLFDDKM